MERLDCDYEFEKKLYESNDASASRFGWDFQENAGIFLFLSLIKKCKTIKIESLYEDIEIQLVDGSMVYAQAKSIQNIDDDSSKSTKLKDSIVSLAKVPADENDQLIYISNIPSPIKTDENYFKNNIVRYDNCRDSYKTAIDRSINSCISKLNTEISRQSSESLNSENLKKLKCRLENFNKKNFYICSIYPFTDKNGDRYQAIKDKLIDFLCNTLGCDRVLSRSIYNRLLSHWQEIFAINCSKKDNKKVKGKEIEKKELVWPIAVLFSEFDPQVISDTLSFVADAAFIDECLKHITLNTQIFHERFEFMNRVLEGYERFKKLKVGTNTLEIEKDFIKSKWEEYKDEFVEVDTEHEKEFLTKYYLYGFVRNYINLLKIEKGVNDGNL